MRRKTQKHYIWVCILLAILFVSPRPVLCAPANPPNPVPRSGDKLPRISIPDKLTLEEKEYLGIPKNKNSALDNIKAKLILIEFLSTNCGHCVSSAPVFNEIYKAIELDPNLRTNIKLLGIATGNTPTEVAEFKSKFSIPFPILPDTEFKAHQAVGQPRVPFIVIGQKDRQNRWAVVSAEWGLTDLMASRSIDNPENNWVAVTLEGSEIFPVQEFIEELKKILVSHPVDLTVKKP